MKGIFSFIFSILFVSASIGQGIQFFEGTWEEALNKAKDDGKLLFVDSYTSWCGPCKRMAKYEFTKADVGEYFNQHFINVKMNMEGAEGRKFGNKYPVSAYPTLFFISSDGKIEKKSVGGKKGNELINLGKEVMSKYDFSVEYKKAYDKGDRTFETVYNYVRTLNQSNKPSLKVSNDYLNSKHGMSDEQMVLFLMEAATEVDSKIFQKFVKKKKVLNQKFGKEVVDDKIKKACFRTIDKAIEFQYPALVEEAADIYRSSINKKSKDFIPSMYIRFAVADNNQEWMKSYSKKFLKHADVKKQFQWAKEALQVFPKSKDILNIGVQQLKKTADKSTELEHIKLYSNLLVKTEQLDEAISFLEKKVTLVKSGAHKNQLQQFINSYKANR